MKNNSRLVITVEALIIAYILLLTAFLGGMKAVLGAVGMLATVLIFEYLENWINKK